MNRDAREVPLDQFEQEMLERLLSSHDERLRAARHRVAAGIPTRPLREWVGRRLQRRVLMVMAVALLAASGSIAAESLLRGSSPPVRLYGGNDLCPMGYDVAADVRTRLFYPPNYPGYEFSEGKTRCFSSAQYAREAGYRLAPIPHGDELVGPIYFARTPAAVQRTCQTAQREIKAVVYCPTRLPTPWVYPLLNGDCPTSDCGIPLLSLSGSFAGPGYYTGSAPGLGDVTIWSASASQRHDFPYVLFECFSRKVLVGRTSFRGHPAAWYRCSVFGSTMSSILDWRIGRQFYEITADGPARLRRAIVSYIAAHLVAERRSS
jgi:hypothetical protein